MAIRGRDGARRLPEPAQPIIRGSPVACPGVAGRVSGALHATRTGTQGTTSALQTLPDTTLMGVAAGSLGVGAGFYLARAPRLAILVGIVPALIMGTAILLRPIPRRSRAEA